jgi:hypothetical protein
VVIVMRVGCPGHMTLERAAVTESGWGVFTAYSFDGSPCTPPSPSRIIGPNVARCITFPTLPTHAIELHGRLLIPWLPAQRNPGLAAPLHSYEPPQTCIITCSADSQTAPQSHFNDAARCVGERKHGFSR